MNHQPDGVVATIYLVSNALIAIGYGAMPALVLPYLPLTRRVLIFGGSFFALCGLTHASMAFGHQHLPVTWFWAVEHALQAIATWGFIITFHALLRRAAARRKLREKIRDARRAGVVDPAGDPPEVPA